MSFDGVPEYGLLAILTFAASKGYQCTSRHISTFFRMLSSLVRREARLPSYFRHNPFSSRVRRITFRILYFRTCSYIVLIAVIYCILKGIPIVSEKQGLSISASICGLFSNYASSFQLSILAVSRVSAGIQGTRLLVDMLNFLEIVFREYQITLARIENGSMFLASRPFEMRSSVISKSNIMFRISVLNFFYASYPSITAPFRDSKS